MNKLMRALDDYVQATINMRESKRIEYSIEHERVRTNLEAELKRLFRLAAVGYTGEF